MPYLVVTQALPGSGKTTVTLFLQSLGFARLSLEDHLKKRMGKNWWGSVKAKDDFWWQDLYEKQMFKPMTQFLKKGKSVAIETTAGATKWFVNHYRMTDLFLRSPNSERYILEIHARSSVRWKRIAKRQRISLREAKKWDESYIWRKRWKPRSIPVTLLRYRNNSANDIEKIQKDLYRRFS